MTVAMNTYPVCQPYSKERSVGEPGTSDDQETGLNDKLALQKRNLELQAQYHHQLQRQIQQQKELQQEIQESLSKLNSATATTRAPARPAPMTWSNIPEHRPPAINLGQASEVKSLDTTSQLEMHQAMQSQMNLHRQVWHVGTYGIMHSHLCLAIDVDEKRSGTPAGEYNTNVCIVWSSCS